MVSPRREPLSRERILDAALALVDESGLEALSMRRLGEALGVEAMSLYNHVPNKGALLDGIHERILAQVAPPLATRDWKAYARHQARSLHATLCAHPGAIGLFATRPAATEASVARLDAYLAALRGAGFAPLDALMVVQIVSAFVVGHALWIAGITDAAARSSPAVVVSPPYASADEVARELDEYDPERELEMGLGALLDGLDGQLRRATRGRGGRARGSTRRR